MQKKALVVLSVEEWPELSLDELCEAYLITPDFIQKLIEYGAIEPKKEPIASWRFNSRELSRIRRILRLQHDLEVNLAGAILVLDLMEQMEKMHTRLAIFEKHFLSRG